MSSLLTKAKRADEHGQVIHLTKCCHPGAVSDQSHGLGRLPRLALNKKQSAAKDQVKRLNRLRAQAELVTEEFESCQLTVR
jgi:hypothetical protein